MVGTTPRIAIDAGMCVKRYTKSGAIGGNESVKSYAKKKTKRIIDLEKTTIIS